MLKDILQKFAGFGSRPPQVDPSRFGDPVALSTQWTPAMGGGANFRTHKLIEVSPYRVEFRSSILTKVFYFVFMIFGLGFTILVTAALILGKAPAMEMIFPALLGLLFFVVGVLMFYFGSAPIVFDKTTGYFWRGRKSPQDVGDVRSLKHATPLSKIHALQLISEYVRGNKTSYYSYELNIVLPDGSRLNVVDHGSLEKLRKDAKTLSKFLGKPIWDAS
ncbi:MAG: hypothetical protein HY562_07865 [Ignavibacteriales bacterium]|nr:hypothetical protein [Ignavibacteriales bacterium]